MNKSEIALTAIIVRLGVGLRDAESKQKTNDPELTIVYRERARTYRTALEIIKEELNS